jgi:hypothetical protein
VAATDVEPSFAAGVGARARVSPKILPRRAALIVIVGFWRVSLSMILRRLIIRGLDAEWVSPTTRVLLRFIDHGRHRHPPPFVVPTGVVPPGG